MHVVEVLKVLNYLKNYDLKKEIDIKCISNLNKKQIKSLLNLMNYCQSKEKLKLLMEVAVNKDSLESEYHDEDMKLIASAKSEEQAKYLSEVAVNKNSLESKYHEEDMKLIALSKDKEKTIYLSKVAVNKNSLESKYHKEDMKLIASAKSEEQSKYLSEVAVNKDSLESEYHEEDMKSIALSKDKEKTIYLSEVAGNSVSLQGNFHRDDMERIKRLSLKKVEAIVGVLDTELKFRSKYARDYISAIENEGNDSQYYDDEYMDYLLATVSYYPGYFYFYDANDDDNKRVIENFNFMDYFNFIKGFINENKNIEENNSAISLNNYLDVYEDLMQEIDFLKSEHYREDLLWISKAKTRDRLYSLKKAAKSEESIQFPYHSAVMKLIAEAKSEEVALCISAYLCARGSTISNFFQSNMSRIFDPIYWEVETISDMRYNLINIAASIEIDDVAGFMRSSLDYDDDYNYNIYYYLSLYQRFKILSKAKYQSLAYLKHCLFDINDKDKGLAYALTELFQEKVTVDDCWHYYQKIEIEDAIKNCMQEIDNEKSQKIEQLVLCISKQLENAYNSDYSDDTKVYYKNNN